MRYFIVLLLLVVSPAFAEPSRIEAGVGVGGQYLRDYRGSKHSGLRALPVPFVTYHGDFLKSDDKGTRGEFFANDRYELNVSAALALNGGSDDNPLREGMPVLRSAYELGPSFNLNLSGKDFGEGWELRLPARFVFIVDGAPKAKGYTLNPKLTFRKPAVWERWSAVVDVGLLYGSTTYHDYYYSVAAPYVTTERPEYDALGGFSGYFTKLALTRRSERWHLGLRFRYDNLSGATFADSPLVETKGYTEFSFIIARKFWRGTFAGF